MCGIAGFTHGRRQFDPDRIHGAVASLIHRGPDQQGVFQSGSVSLGATRLKIIDLDGGDQPIFSESRDTVVVFNGEIYNHAELRRELLARGHRFQSSTDTEVVLRAFLEWDTDCFPRLRGMFAVALWTESSRRLVLARDRIGIKPLYIARCEEDLYFGSEIKALLIHPEIDRRLSLEGLDCYLSVNYAPSPWTLVEGIEKLLPGNFLEWRNGKVRTEFYWRLPARQHGRQTVDGAKEQLDSLLKQSVSEHLISDVPLGIWLSGGIDSSAILHYAAAASSSRLKTFSISFRGRSFDETDYIGEMVRQYGTEHEQLDLNADSGLQDAIEEFAYYADEPNADAGALPVWFLSRMTRKTATVALSGEGADELFGGYLTYRANRLANPLRSLPAGLLSSALPALRFWPVSDEKISLEYKLKRFVEGCRLSPGRAHVYWNGTFSDSEKRSLTRFGLPAALRPIVAEYNDALGDEAVDLWFDQKYFLPDDILTKVDRISMAHAVEVRPPFLDHRIVEFAASLPIALKIRGARQKVILKELMKGKLPASILKRRKIGLDIPAHEWLRGPLRGLLLDTLASGAREYGDLFRVDTIEDCVRQHMDRRANLGYHLWGLMILFLWMKKWRIQTVSVPSLGRQVSEIA